MLGFACFRTVGGASVVEAAQASGRFSLPFEASASGVSIVKSDETRRFEGRIPLNMVLVRRDLVSSSQFKFWNATVT